MEVLSSVKLMGGTLTRVKHSSTATATPMTFAIFIPGVVTGPPAGGWPTLYWLSGLTADDTNFSQKATGAFAAAADEGVAIVITDTSPRGDLPGGDNYDFGTGAGFYLDATTPEYKKNFKMFTYVTEELPALVCSEFNCSKTLKSISGHSMGGHGALTIAMRTKAYVSVSAFAPICAPTQCGWGQKAFNGYLGSVAAGSEYDATEVIKKHGPFDFELFVDQGSEDEFLVEQLKPDLLESACAAKKQKLRLRKQAGYDHSYFFVASFIKDHVAYHAGKMRERGLLAFKEAPVVAVAVSAPGTAAVIITCRAMVAFAAKEPLECCEVLVAPPRAGEVRVKVVANALCHTDVYTWSGQDPEGLFPAILGHEAGAIVEAVGAGVLSLKIGDHVVPGYTPQCSETSCIFCMSPKTNLCPKIRGSQGAGKMPDGTTRFTLKKDGSEIFHFMGCSTFSEYTVLAEISCAKISPAMPLYKACLFGCGVSTGFGAVLNTTKVTPGSSVAVFGCGAVGLAVIQAAKQVGATRIFAIDLNQDKFEIARKLGATDCVDPSDSSTPIAKRIVAMTQWGVDFTFDCTGNTEVMRSALECAHRGWGVSCVIGVAASGKEISTRPFQLVTGRKWVGTAFGGFKTRTDVPKLVDSHLQGKLPIDHFITHTLSGVDKTNEAIHILEGGSCLRCVVIY